MAAGQKFEGDDAVQPRVASLVHDTHAASADPFEQLVMKDCPTGRRPLVAIALLHRRDGGDDHVVRELLEKAGRSIVRIEQRFQLCPEHGIATARLLQKRLPVVRRRVERVFEEILEATGLLAAQHCWCSQCGPRG